MNQTLQDDGQRHSTHEIRNGQSCNGLTAANCLTRYPLILPSLVWLVGGLIGLLAGLSQGADLLGLILPLALWGAVPALLTLALLPVLHREWAQIIVLFGWIGLAVLGCMVLGFIPMVVLFLAVPAIAMLFVRETVLEATILSMMIAFALFLAMQSGYLGESVLTRSAYLDRGAARVAQAASLAALLGLILSAMYMAARQKTELGAGATEREADQSVQVLDADSPERLWRDGVDGGLFEYNAKGRLIGANAQADAQFLGHIPPQLDGFFPDTHMDYHNLYEAVSAAHQSKAPHSIRITHDQSGVETQYDMRITPLKKGGVLIYMRDVENSQAAASTTTARSAPLADTPSSASALSDGQDKTLFFAGVSHELRTPLNAIIGFSDMMRARLFGPLPSKYAEYAGLIHDSGQHMLDLIGDVLDLSKADAGRYELNYDTFDAVDVINSSVKMMRPSVDAAGLSLDVNLDLEGSLLLQADRRALRQILLNLLSNAVKFSQNGGRIDVDAQAIDGDLELTISDQGLGMSAEDIAHIGQPYRQGDSAQLTTERGSGLGLALVRSLTELHGGRMKIQSELNEGTRVRVSLPLQPD